MAKGTRIISLGDETSTSKRQELLIQILRTLDTSKEEMAESILQFQGNTPAQINETSIQGTMQKITNAFTAEGVSKDDGALLHSYFKNQQDLQIPQFRDIRDRKNPNYKHPSKSPVSSNQAEKRRTSKNSCANTSSYHSELVKADSATTSLDHSIIHNHIEFHLATYRRATLEKDAFYGLLEKDLLPCSRWNEMHAILSAIQPESANGHDLLTLFFAARFAENSKAHQLLTYLGDRKNPLVKILAKFEQGKRHYRARDHEQAIPLFESAVQQVTSLVKQDETTAQLRLLAAVIANFAANNLDHEPFESREVAYQQAWKCISDIRISSQDPDYAWLVHMVSMYERRLTENIARLYEDNEDWKQALIWHNESRNRQSKLADPDRDPRAWFNAAYILVSNQQLSADAITESRRLIEEGLPLLSIRANSDETAQFYHSAATVYEAANDLVSAAQRMCDAARVAHSKSCIEDFQQLADALQSRANDGQRQKPFDQRP